MQTLGEIFVRGGEVGTWAILSMTQQLGFLCWRHCLTAALELRALWSIYCVIHPEAVPGVPESKVRRKTAVGLELTQRTRVCWEIALGTVAVWVWPLADDNLTQWLLYEIAVISARALKFLWGGRDMKAPAVSIWRAQLVGKRLYCWGFSPLLLLLALLMIL